MSSASSKSSANEAMQLRVFSLNCWGLKYISKFRNERLTEIARRIVSASPAHDIVALQEFWVYDDYVRLRSITSGVLPYGKFYHSGVLGGGLVVLSRYPIVGSTMFGYTLNGRPTAFWRGDWYVGKGVANAVIDLGNGRIVEVFNTHLHAPYEAGEDSYLCHRTAQAWEIAKHIRGAVQKGHIPIALGDFNMIPSSLAHHIITTRGLVSDSWLSKYPDTPTESSANKHAQYNIEVLGATCDSILNTWRLPKDTIEIPAATQTDPKAKRLDYIFHSKRACKVVDVKVGNVHPMKLPFKAKPGQKGVATGGLISLSDHYSVEVVFELPPRRVPPLITLGDAEQEAQEGHEEEYLSLDVIDEIQALSAKYTKREKFEYKWRIAHFWLSLPVIAGLHIGTYFVSTGGLPGLAVGLSILTWVVAVTGTVNGLIGFLFMGSELNALKEFDYEVKFYRRIVEEKFRTNEGLPKVPVSGAVTDESLTINERIEEELVLESRADAQRAII